MAKQYTLTDLDAQVTRMQHCDKPAPMLDAAAYADQLRVALAGLPRLSSKQIGCVMEALHAAFQLGQLLGIKSAK